MKISIYTLFFIIIIFSVSSIAQKKALISFESDLQISELLDILQQNIVFPQEYDTQLKQKAYLNSNEGKEQKKILLEKKKTILNDKHYLKSKINLSSYYVKQDGFFIELYRICPISDEERNRFIGEKKCISKFIFNSLPLSAYDDGLCLVTSLKIQTPEHIATKIENKEVDLAINFNLTGNLKKFYYEDKILNYYHQTFYYAETQNVELVIYYDNEIIYTKKIK